MRILLTGASGFAGAHLAAHLFHREGHELFVLPSPNFRRERLAGVGYEVVSHAAQARAELVYHLASTPLTASISARLHENVIVGGTRLLLEELRAHQPRRLVMAGSAAEYGPGHGWREDDCPHPDTAFGHYKRAAAEMARASGIASVHLRLFTPFGEGEAEGRLGPTVARAALEGKPVRLAYDGRQTRDYFHVACLVEALVEAGRRPLEPGVAINVCSGTARRVIDVARRLAELAGADPALVEPGPLAAPYLWQSSGNRERAERLLGWWPRIDFDDGLRRTLAACGHANAGHPRLMATAEQTAELGDGAPPAFSGNFDDRSRTVHTSPPTQTPAHDARPGILREPTSARSSLTCRQGDTQT